MRLISGFQIHEIAATVSLPEQAQQDSIRLLKMPRCAKNSAKRSPYFRRPKFMCIEKIKKIRLENYISDSRYLERFRCAHRLQNWSNTEQKLGFGDKLRRFFEKTRNKKVPKRKTKQTSWKYSSLRSLWYLCQHPTPNRHRERSDESWDLDSHFRQGAM